jgi:hypothetical protein
MVIIKTAKVSARLRLAPLLKKILILFMNVLLLSSCFKGGRRMHISEGEKADARIEQILDAIKDKDRETLRSLFSQKALEEAKEFDDGIDYLFGFFQGNIDSWERDKWSSGDKIEYGKRSEMLRSWYIVTTDEERYIFFVIDFTIDTINPNNAGLYTLCVMKEEDRETQFGYWQSKYIAGIYKP